jgi:putative transposase
MIIAHVYKIEPAENQVSTMDNWLFMLSAQYNFRLAERIAAYEQTKISGAYCDIRTKTERMPIACSLSKYALYGDPFKMDKKTGEAKKRSGFEIQCADLVNLKQSRPWYGGIYSIVLQQMLKQLDTAYKNFFEKGRGYPRFKRRAEYKS